MAKFNKKIEPQVRKTVTHQGGTGLTQRPEHELVGILAAGLDNTYYEREDERDKRFTEVLSAVAKKDSTFAAKALIYARTVFGQRTVTHRGAVEMAKHLSGTELAKKFFSKRDRKENRGGIVYRLDDMTEILACYFAKNGDKAPIPNSIKKGFKDAIEHADAYQLAKYQMKGKSVSLVDIVNLVHPVETSTNGYVFVTETAYLTATSNTKFAEREYEKTKSGEVKLPTLRALVLGLLKQFDTVENKNTEAGKTVAAKVMAGTITQEEATEELNSVKTENFSELIQKKKIGYLALLRNLRNILKTKDTALLEDACELLIQKNFIRKSLVWPHQIDLAQEVMTIEFSGKSMAKVTQALNTAYELSIPNLKELLPEGRTAVVFDTSASMRNAWNGGILIPYNGSTRNINASPAEKAALIAATFAKGVYGDVYHFADHASQIVGWNPNDSVNTLKKLFTSYNGKNGHGTEFGSCFQTFVRENKQYDRVVIVSDEQDGYGNVESNFKSYCEKFGTPYVYIINLCGYQNTAPIKSNSRVFRLYGYSADLYDKITQMEINPNVIIDEINKIEI